MFSYMMMIGATAFYLAKKNRTNPFQLTIKRKLFQKSFKTWKIIFLVILSIAPTEVNGKASDGAGP